MFCVRPIQLGDLEAILELAGYLDTMNLPRDRTMLADQISKSVQAFTNKKLPKEEALYMFALEDLDKKKVVGTSLIFGKHGTKAHPHTFLQTLKKSYEDPDLKIKMEHKLLRFEYDSDGPSEIGGLILHPDYRASKAGLGTLLVYSRFMYMGIFKEKFEREVIAELLPPFNEDGSSELWESLGRRFTGLSYKDADRLSRTNKDFIKNLFPEEDIHITLFSERAQRVIGETGEGTKPLQHLLTKAGFNYLDTVDPFDGGPHYGAKTAEVSVIKRLKKVSVSHRSLDSQGNKGLIAGFSSGQFYCFLNQAKEDGKKIEIADDLKKVFTDLKIDIENLVWSHLL